jgi:multicomponent Na+:H+ antiporter subunit F
MTAEQFLDITIYAVLVLLGLSVTFTFIRLVKGPSLPDRVVALDMIANGMIGLIAVDAIFTREHLFLRAAITLALLAFLSTLAFAFYIQKGKTQ